MGMAASQARFLGLTAKQNNLQFEGQNINQQRTSLSNQSANCYNTLLSINVPVPPSTDDYTKLVYTFTPTISTTATINQIFANPGESDYKIIYTEYGTKEGIISTMNKAVIGQSENSQQAILNGILTPFVPVTVNSEDEFNSYGTSLFTITGDVADPAAQFVQGTTYYTIAYTANGAICGEVTEGIQNFVNSDLDPNDYYQYKVDDVCYYIKRNEAAAIAGQSTKISVYSTGSVTVSEMNTDEHGVVEYDANARVSSITIHRNNVAETYAVTADTEVDSNAYENAYNQYVYEQYLYDQEQNKINASIEIIQAEDKTLELRLKQLDTENNAIKTEIEAVSKVLSDNIEKSFKTFNA